MTCSIFRLDHSKYSLALALCAAGFGLALSGPARADAIDGTWCSVQEARMLTIQGSQLIVDRSVSTGQYSRHNLRRSMRHNSQQKRIVRFIV